MEAQAWSTYWQSSGSGDAAVRSNARGQSYEAFWGEIGQNFIMDGQAQSHIDLACGSGLVSQSIRSRIGADHVCEQHVMDVSEAAVRMASERSDAVKITPLVASGARLPYKDGAFDLVTSQYGIEYAGREALREALRLVAPGGWLIALIHVKGGPIARECQDNLDCLEHARETELLPRMRAAFLDAAESGDMAVSLHQELDWQRQAVDCPARDFLLRLLSDARTLWQRREAYRPEEALGWLAHQDSEVDAYIARMRSMIEASRSRSDLLKVFEPLDAEALARLALSEFVLSGDQEPSAWHLAVNKRPS